MVDLSLRRLLWIRTNPVRIIVKHRYLCALGGWGRVKSSETPCVCVWGGGACEIGRLRRYSNGFSLPFTVFIKFVHSAVASHSETSAHL